MAVIAAMTTIPRPSAIAAAGATINDQVTTWPSVRARITPIDMGERSKNVVACAWVGGVRSVAVVAPRVATTMGSAAEMRSHSIGQVTMVTW